TCPDRYVCEAEALRAQIISGFREAEEADDAAYLGVETHEPHDSEMRGRPTGVYKGTRESVIQRLEGWIEDPVGKGRVYWVRGAAGTGKSTIARTICEKYAGTLLAASFSFSRNDSLRNSLDHFVPTIAYQLAESHRLCSEFNLEISDLLSAEPLTTNVDWEEQFSRLISLPCAAINAELWPSLPRLIVIDGLEECMDRDPQTGKIDQQLRAREGQRRLLSAIHATSTQPSSPLDFLIFSRPGPTIATFFRSHPFNPALERFDMQELRSQADADIKLYLRDQFTRLVDLHPDAGLEKAWPGKEVIHELTLNADGCFSYVATAIRYITGDDPDLPLPQQRLEIVLCASRTSLYRDLSPLDQLYQHILQPFMRWRERLLLPILRLIIFPSRDPEIPGSSPTFSLANGSSYRSQHAIAELLKLDPEQVSAVLSQLHSVLHVPDDRRMEDVKILDGSFSDFLTDKRRSLDSHVEPLGD
ncbi:hypothetical protein V5O48_018523, partial [Marasmius crinis-equi]